MLHLYVFYSDRFLKVIGHHKRFLIVVSLFYPDSVELSSKHLRDPFHSIVILLLTNIVLQCYDAVCWVV